VLQETRCTSRDTMGCPHMNFGLGDEGARALVDRVQGEMRDLTRGQPVVGDQMQQRMITSTGPAAEKADCG
jgi:hypothetical protein